MFLNFVDSFFYYSMNRDRNNGELINWKLVIFFKGLCNKSLENQLLLLLIRILVNQKKAEFIKRSARIKYYHELFFLCTHSFV